MISLELTGDEQKAMQAILKLTQSQEKLEKKTADVNAAARKAGEQFTKSFGREMEGALSAIITKVGSATAAVALLKQGFDAAERARQQAMEGHIAGERGHGELIDIARNDAAQLQKYRQYAQTLREMGGAVGTAEASHKVALLQKAGALSPENLALTAAMYPLPGEAAATVGSAQRVSSAWHGQAGTARDAIARSLAMGDRRGADLESFMGTLANIAPRMTGHAYISSEVEAVLANLTRKLGSPEVAGQAMIKLTEIMEKTPGLSRKGLLEQVEILDRRHLPATALRELLNDKGGKSFATFRLTAESRNRIKEMAAEIAAPSKEDALGQLLGLGATVPGYAEVAGRRAALETEAVELSPRGIEPLTREQKQAILRTLRRRAGQSELVGWMSDMATDAMHWVGIPAEPDPEGFIRRTPQLWSNPNGPTPADFEAVGKGLRDLAQGLSGANEAINRLAGPHVRTVGKPEDDR